MKQKEMHEIAMVNPFNSIVRHFEPHKEYRYFLGVKNDAHISKDWILEICQKNDLFLHTVDVKAAGGRAVDLSLINPITGRYMTGSSSGTSINVFLGINDIGIGTDGGGSVLAPAMSLNLYSFVSKLILEDHLKKYQKTSTDGITFSVSIGYITRTLQPLLDMISWTIPKGNVKEHPKVAVFLDDQTKYPFETEKIDKFDVYQDRKTCITFLTEVLNRYDILILKEGPVDVLGFGDTVFGHFDETTKQIQQAAKKGLVRVVNMVNATAITIPTSQLGCAYVCICKSNVDDIATMLAYAKKFSYQPDALIERYFRSVETWKGKGFGDEI